MASAERAIRTNNAAGEETRGLDTWGGEGGLGGGQATVGREHGAQRDREKGREDGKKESKVSLNSGFNSIIIMGSHPLWHLEASARFLSRSLTGTRYLPLMAGNVRVRCGKKLHFLFQGYNQQVVGSLAQSH